MKSKFCLLAAIATVASASSVFAAGYLQLAAGTDVRPSSYPATTTTSSAISGNSIYTNVTGGSGGNANIAITRFAIGGSTTDKYISNTTWNTATGATPGGMSGFIYNVGPYFLVADNTANKIMKIDFTGGTASSYTTYSAVFGATGSVGAAGVGPYGQLLFNNTNATNTANRGISVTKSDGTITTLIAGSAVSAASGGTAVAGLAQIGNKIYFGGNTTRDLYVYDLDNTSLGIKSLVTSTDIKTATGASSNQFLGSAFIPIGNSIYFFDNSAKGIYSVDVNTKAISTVLTSTDLTNGPMASTAVGGFTVWNEKIAFYNVSASGVAGVYAIPEPSALGLVVPALVALRRNRRA
jgi:hypothetical protein